LVPPNLDGELSFWRADIGITEVDIFVVLATEASITKFILLVDSLGYSEYDVPSIKIYSGLTRNALSLIETWELPSTGVDGGSSLVLTLKSPVNCRLVKLSLTLPRRASSLDSVGVLMKNSEGGPFLHLGKLRISGIPTPCVCTPQCKASFDSSPN
jgi:hypothetical protein